MPINHTKTNSIADWTQADLDAAIAAGLFPSGTVLADIVLPSDWNADHTNPDIADVTGLQTALDGKTSGTGTAGYLALWSSTSALTLASDASNQLYWDSANYRLGLGTTSPSSRLHVTQTMTDTATTSKYLTNNSLTVTPSGASDTNFYGGFNTAATSGANNLTGIVVGHRTLGAHSGTGTLADLRGANNQASVNAGAGSVTSAYGALNNVSSAVTSGIAIGNARGAYNYVQNNSTGTITTAQGSLNVSLNSSTGTLTTAYGAHNYTQNVTTGTITTAYGAADYISNAGTITTAYSIRAHLVNSGTVTTWYGLYIPAITGGGTTTNAYPIYIADTNTSYMAGGIRYAASQYINWGATAGSSGYGIRDNAGTIEIKNSGGSWAAPSGGGAGVLTNELTSNYYFGFYQSAATSNLALVANTAYLIPFMIGDADTVTRIGVNVTTAVAATNVRIGIYNQSGGYPTSLVLDCGTVSSATTGEKEITISQSLSLGTYALVVVSDGAPTLAASGITAASAGHLFGFSSSTSAGVAHTATFTYGALPSTWSASWTRATANVPGTWMRKV